MSTSQPAGEGLSLSERLELQQQQQLAKSYREKLASGQRTTRAEQRAFAKIEQLHLQEFGLRFLDRMPKKHYQRITARQSKQLLECSDRYGFPYDVSAPTVNVSRILRWFHDFLAANGSSLVTSDGEDAILQLASKELKDEYVKRRIAEKDLDIERKRIEVETLSSKYVPIEPLREYHNSLSRLLRRLQMKLAKHFDGEDREIIENGFDDLIHDCERLAESHFAENGSNINDMEAVDALEEGSAQ